MLINIIYLIHPPGQQLFQSLAGQMSLTDAPVGGVSSVCPTSGSPFILAKAHINSAEAPG